MEKKREYNTKQLEMIEECLKKSGGHMTAENIVVQLRSCGESVGTATVYRNLQKLEDRGLVQKYTGGDCACFAYAGGECNSHFHLKCTKCGKLIHMECSHMDSITQHILAEHNFAVDRFKTVFYGICEDCRK